MTGAAATAAAEPADYAVQAELSSRTDLQGMCFPSATQCPSGAATPSPPPVPPPADSLDSYDAWDGMGVV